MSNDETGTDRRRARLVEFLRNLPSHVQDRLATAKSDGKIHRSRPDWLWYSLVTSFSTMGNSRGYAALMADPVALHGLSYEVLVPLNNKELRKSLELCLRRAKVRMPGRKADWLARNFKIIEKMGGIRRANAIAFAQPDRAAKIAFLQQFDGIGDKYSRNIWMDIYDPDFHDAVAIDQRIKKVSAALGISFKRYEDHEQYYRGLAKTAGLQPWELDRVLYGFLPDVLNVIAETPRRKVSRTSGFTRLLKEAREKACKAGMRKSDVAAAVRKVRKPT